MCMCVCLWGYIDMTVGAHGSHAKVLDPLEMEFQVLFSHWTWVLGIKLRPPLQEQVLFIIGVIPLVSTPEIFKRHSMQ